jgi:hypothetical protein
MLRFGMGRVWRVAGPGLVREGQYQGYLTDTVIFLRSHFLTDQVGISDLPPAK